jgi:hypothetical protein
MAVVKLNTILYDSPFGDDCDFEKIENIVGVPVNICEVKPVMMKSGKAVYFRYDGGRKYTITFAKSIVDTLARPDVLAVFERGDVVACTVIERPSQDNPDRNVLVLS